MSGVRSVLIVDDDKEMRLSLVELVEAAGFSATALPRAAEVARALAKAPVDVILSDVRMPGMTGMELLDALAGTGAPPVVLISAHGDIPMAVEAMSAGAYSFVEKPYDPRRLLTILTHAADQHRMLETNARMRDRLLQLSGLNRVLLGEAPAMTALREDVLSLAGSPVPALLVGETGTGKEVVARALHDLGRSEGPFLAATGAQLTGDGLVAVLQRADGGTLFLDEIATTQPEVQAMLLRAIEMQEVLNPATGRTLTLDMRVVAAMNEDPDAAVADGRLRQDLLYRLAGVRLDLPPLRSRREDITLLATHFMAEAARTYEIRPPELTEDDLAALISHDWPGNVRELRNVAERRVLLAKRGTGSIAEALRLGPDVADIPHTLREAVAAFERELIGKAITAHSGRMDAVAEALGIGRRTLNEKIVKLGLNKDALL